jgi:hypothetical protein
VDRPAASPPPIEVRSRPPIVVARPRPVLCDVTSTTPTRKGSLIHATCPPGPTPPVGSQGRLLDAQGNEIDQGDVVIKQVAGNKIVGETPLRKVKAAKVKFMRD